MFCKHQLKFLVSKWQALTACIHLQQAQTDKTQINCAGNFRNMWRKWPNFFTNFQAVVNIKPVCSSPSLEVSSLSQSYEKRSWVGLQCSITGRKSPIVNCTFWQSEWCSSLFPRLWAGSECKHILVIRGRPVHSHILPLSSRRWGQYQIILLGDRGTCVNNLPTVAYLAVRCTGVKPGTSGSLVWHATTTPSSHTGDHFKN